MAYDYDALYKTTPNALGEPTQVFVDFFEAQTGQSLRVLDIGCGQGRDALFIARKGHRVVGVDLSPSGIDDLNAAAKAEGLPVTGIAADITGFTPDGPCDVLLIDRTLHMLAEAPRLEALARLIGYVDQGGWVLIADERSNMDGFKQVFAQHSADWAVQTDAKGYLFLQRR